ncbi:hypothetical protein OH687_34680 [Burkholderia anthina]|nr:hypothetical protein OH687_34680 [Burkholderia anthina]
MNGACQAGRVRSSGAPRACFRRVGRTTDQAGEGQKRNDRCH